MFQGREIHGRHFRFFDHSGNQRSPLGIDGRWIEVSGSSSSGGTQPRRHESPPFHDGSVPVPVRSFNSGQVH